VKPPTKKLEARDWAKGALRNGDFIPSVHFRERLRERGVNMLDVHAVFIRCKAVEPYPAGACANGGTTWRVIGPDADGDRFIAIGIEAYVKGGTKWVTLCTVFEVEK